MSFAHVFGPNWCDQSGIAFFTANSISLGPDQWHFLPLFFFLNLQTYTCPVNSTSDVWGLGLRCTAP